MEYRKVDGSSVIKFGENVGSNPAKLGQPDPRKGIPVGPTPPEIIIKLTNPLGKEATILLHPTGPQTMPPAKEDIQALLSEYRIVHGINWPLIDDLCIRPVFYHTFVLARAAPPRKGADGYVEYFFNTQVSLIPKESADGTVDYKDLDFIRVVEQGQLLARRHPALKGADGVDIFGQPIEGVFGEPPLNPKGKNTETNEDETELVAAVAGHIRHEFGIVSVIEVLVLNNIDNSTGNIDYVGDIMIRGDIAPGFTVKASGSINIKGSIEGAIIEAGDSVTVAGGILGAEKGSIKAGTDVRCKFIQNSRVSASGSVYADSIVLSDVKAGGDLVLSGSKGSLVGGRTDVSGKVVAKNIGSVRGVPTEVFITSSEEETEEVSELVGRVFEISAEMSDVLSEIKSMENTDQARLSPQEKRNMLKLTTRYNERAMEREEIEERLDKLQAKWASEIRSKYFVECRGTIFSGTKININGVVLKSESDLNRARVYINDGEITHSNI